MKKVFFKNSILCAAIAVVAFLLWGVFFGAGCSASLNTDLVSSILTIAAHAMASACFMVALIGLSGVGYNLSKIFKKRIK